MTRYEPVDEDDNLFLAAEDGDRVEIGAIDDVVAAMGGDTHPIEYTRSSASSRG